MLLWDEVPTGVKISAVKREGERAANLSLVERSEKVKSDWDGFSFPVYAPLLRAHTSLFKLSVCFFITGYNLLHLYSIRLFAICGSFFRTMGDSVFLDRQNAYLVSTRFTGHKIIVNTARSLIWFAAASSVAHVCACVACASLKTTGRCLFKFRMCIGRGYFLHCSQWSLNSAQI